MASSPIPLLLNHIEMTLRLVISMSPNMTVEELVAARVHLHEADFVLGRILVDRDVLLVNGQLELV
jgi:hypothetical protein